MHVLKKYTDPIDKKKQHTHSNLGQSNRLPMCILPLRPVRLMYIRLVRSHNQLCTSYTLINLYYIHSRRWMTEAARWDKIGVLQRAMVCWLAHTATWRHRREEVQTSQSEAIRSIEECSWTLFRSPKTANLRSVGEVCLARLTVFAMCPRSFLKLRLKLRGDIAKSY